MKIQVFTRSQNNELYEMMRSFIPEDVECVKCTGFDKWWEAADFIHHVVKTAEEWAIILDEDAFVTDWGRLMSIVDWMDFMGRDIAGHPDAGVIPHRNHSFLHLNPFFNIINTVSFREEMERQHITKETINLCGYSPAMEDLRPAWLHTSGNHNNTEPFAGFYYWAATFTKPVFLKAHTYTDGISTISLDLIDEKPFLYHSWYSREFNTNPSQRERILSLYEKAKKEKV